MRPLTCPAVGAYGVSHDGFVSERLRSVQGMDESRVLHQQPGPATGHGELLTIDCGRCLVRPQACGDCVVTALLGAPDEGVSIDADEGAALQALSAAGLVSPLRLVTQTGSETIDDV